MGTLAYGQVGSTTKCGQMDWHCGQASGRQADRQTDVAGIWGEDTRPLGCLEAAQEESDGNSSDLQE